MNLSIPFYIWVIYYWKTIGIPSHYKNVHVKKPHILKTTNMCAHCTSHNKKQLAFSFFRFFVFALFHFFVFWSTENFGDVVVSSQGFETGPSRRSLEWSSDPFGNGHHFGKKGSSGAVHWSDDGERKSTCRCVIKHGKGWWSMGEYGKVRERMIQKDKVRWSTRKDGRQRRHDLEYSRRWEGELWIDSFDL